MNGKPRDSIETDLRAGWPTISPKADALAKRVTALMSASESERLYKTMDRQVESSPAWRAWVLDHRRYLAAFDAVTATTLESLLEREYKRHLQRATNHGSEADGPPVSDE